MVVDKCIILQPIKYGMRILFNLITDYKVIKEVFTF